AGHGLDFGIHRLPGLSAHAARPAGLGRAGTEGSAGLTPPAALHKRLAGPPSPFTFRAVGEYKKHPAIAAARQRRRKLPPRGYTSCHVAITQRSSSSSLPLTQIASTWRGLRTSPSGS